MNTHDQQGKRRQNLTAYLAEHDTRCPKCGYNLRQIEDSICSECGLMLAELPLHHLPNIFYDARFEQRVVRLEVCCILVVCSPALIFAVQASSVIGALVITGLYLTVAASCISIERNTHRRHIRKSKTTFYDGTTCFGTYALLIISILVLPTILLIINLSASLISML